MSSISHQFPSTAGSHNDRFTGIAVTLGVHLALILAWQLAGKLPQAVQEGSDEAMLWLSLPAPATASAPPEPVREILREPAATPVTTVRAVRTNPVPSVQVSELPATAPAPAVEAPPAAAPSAAEMLADARRSVGQIDRALRKENKPLIVAPPDSPQIRMRDGIEHARAMAAPRLWEAPKVEELVNNTGDGARRSRVITGRGTYCITERAPTTNIEMIEMHGKQRFTNCPKDETPPKQQVWRTARD